MTILLVDLTVLAVLHGLWWGYGWVLVQDSWAVIHPPKDAA